MQLIFMLTTPKLELLPWLDFRDPARVWELGVVIADGREGPFELELAGVSAWRSAGPAGMLMRLREAEARPSTMPR